MPTARQASTSISTGKRIQRGGSWGVRGRAVAGGPKNAPLIRRSEEITLNTPHADAATASTRLTGGTDASVANTTAKNISSDRKPFNKGTPAIAALATMASVAVIGI